MESKFEIGQEVYYSEIRRLYDKELVTTIITNIVDNYVEVASGIKFDTDRMVHVVNGGQPFFNLFLTKDDFYYITEYNQIYNELAQFLRFKPSLDELRKAKEVLNLKRFE